MRALAMYYRNGDPNGCEYFDLEAPEWGDEAEVEIGYLTERLTDAIPDDAAWRQITLLVGPTDDTLETLGFYDTSEGNWTWIDCECCSERKPVNDDDVCASCAEQWDDDYARSYGPTAEAARIRTMNER